MRSVELKQSVVSDFSIKSFGNYIVVQSPTMEAIVFNMLNEPDTAELFPYATMKINVPQCKPVTKLLKGVNMLEMYTNAAVLEQQELGLDPIYVAERSVDPTKVRLVDVQCAPAGPILAILTTYGACQILARHPNSRDWKHQIADITQLLITTVFPIEISPSDLKTFAQLRGFVNLYNCTACCWHDSGNVIYAANARGHVVTFRVNGSLLGYDITEQNDFLEYDCKTSTDLGRICYLKSFDDFLIAVNADGLLSLLKFSHTKTENPSIEHVTKLWSQRDRMCCRQIVVQKCPDNSGYAILCAKGAHLIFFHISASGELKGTKTLHIPGIRITGLELFGTDEVIATTVMGSIVHVRFELRSEKPNIVSLHMEATTVSAPQIDSANYQILGVGASMNKALWFFLIDPNKDLHVALKQDITHILLCLPSTLNPAEKLFNTKIDKMDPYSDLMLALRMDIWHSCSFNEYSKSFSLLESLSLSKQVDDTFLQHLQINLEIYRATIRQSNYKLQIVNEFVQEEVKFPELSIQLAHIILRLQYLQSVIVSKGNSGFQALTTFQQKAALTMRKVFYILIEELKEIGENASRREGNAKAKETVHCFVDLFQREIHAKWGSAELDTHSAFKEKCYVCQEPLDDESLTCRSNHNIKRCNVSFMQQTWFNERFCSQCGTVATNLSDSHDSLAELFPPNESVKCTFCRSSFISKVQL